MARARHLWAVVAALLFSGAALAQSSWPAQVVDTAPSGTCTAATYKGAVVVRNTADLWRCLDLDGNGTANWTQSRAVRYQDLDTNGDGVADHRVVGDYDGDGSLESDDIQDAIDDFCDVNGDGTQDRSIAVDSDADGSLDETSKTCGTVLVLDGTYTTATSGASSRLFIKWGGLTVRLGKGAVIKSGITTSELWSRNTPGVGVLYNEVVTIGDYLMTTGVSRVRFEGGTIIGAGWADRATQCTTYSCVDALDADQDGTIDGAQHGLAVYGCDDCTVTGVTIRDCDRIGLYTGGDIAAGDQRVTYVGNTIENVGEHCSAHNIATITATGNVFRSCDALNRHFGTHKDGGRAFEVYASGTEAAAGNRQIVFSDNVVDGFNDGVATLYNTGATVTWDNIAVTNNSFRDFSGFPVRLQTTAAGQVIENANVSGNVMTESAMPESAGIYINELAGEIKNVAVMGNTIRMTSTGAAAGAALAYGIFVLGDSFAISGNQVETVSDGTESGGQYDGCYRILGNGHAISGNSCFLNHATNSAAGFSLVNVTQSTISGNTVRTIATSGTVDGFYLLNVTDSVFSANSVFNAMRGFYGWGSGGNIARNSWTGNKCYNTNNCISIDTPGTNTQNVAIGNEANDCNWSALSWAWADHESAGTAGSNFWDGNIATGCYTYGDEGSSRAGNSHGTVWMIDEDANSAWDTYSFQRYSDKSSIDLNYDRGLRFRNTAGDKYVTLKMGGEPYLGTTTTLSLPAADGVVTVAPVTGYAFSQCTQWNADGYLTGTGSPCNVGDVTQVGTCASGPCFQYGVFDSDGTGDSQRLCWTDSGEDNQFCINTGSWSVAVDVEVAPPAAGTALCAKGDGGCGDYSLGLDSANSATTPYVARDGPNGEIEFDPDEDGMLNFIMNETAANSYLYWDDGNCAPNVSCALAVNTWCNPGDGSLCWCDASGSGDWICGSAKSLEKADSDGDGTDSVDVNGMFSNQDPLYPTWFRFDSNGDGALDVALDGDGTDSGLVLYGGSGGFIQYGAQSKLKLKICGAPEYYYSFFWDEDDDGTAEAEDFCYGVGGYDRDCNCAADSVVDFNGDGTTEITLSLVGGYHLELDLEQDGTVEAELSAAGEFSGNAASADKIDADYDGTPEVYVSGDGIYFDPEEYGTPDFEMKIEDTGTDSVGIFFHGGTAPTINHDDPNELLTFDTDEDGTAEMTLDGSAVQLTLDPNSDGTADMLLNQTFLQTDQVRYSSTSSARMTATNGRMHMCGGNQFAPNAAAGACMSLGGSTGTYEDVIEFDPDGDGTGSYKFGPSNLYMDTNEDGTYNATWSESGAFSYSILAFGSNNSVLFTADNDEDGTGSVQLNVEGKGRLIWDGLLGDCDGDGSALGYDATTDTLVCGDDDTGGASPNLWATIDTASGTDLTADNTADTLILAAGTGISITGDGTNTVTIANTASASGDVTDVFGCASGDCNDISVADGEQLDFSSVNNSATTEGLVLPQATSVLTGTATGQIGFDTTDGRGAVYVGGTYNGLALAVPVNMQSPEYVYAFADFIGPSAVGGSAPFYLNEGNLYLVSSTDANPETTSSAIGNFQLTTGSTAGNEASLGMGYSTNTTTQQFEPRKMRIFGARGQSAAKANAATRKLAVGGIRTSSDGNWNTKTDGIYFWCDPSSDLDNDGTVGDVDSDGTGTAHPDGDCADASEDADDCKWYAVTMNNASDGASGTIATATNTTATNSSIDCSGDTLTYQTLEIAFDGTTVAFYINGSSVRSDTSNIPADGRRLFTWGIYIDQNIAASKPWYIDWMRYYGLR